MGVPRPLLAPRSRACGREGSGQRRGLGSQRPRGPRPAAEAEEGAGTRQDGRGARGAQPGAGRGPRGGAGPARGPGPRAEGPATARGSDLGPHLKSLSLDVIFSSKLEMWYEALAMLTAAMPARRRRGCCCLLPGLLLLLLLLPGDRPGLTTPRLAGARTHGRASPGAQALGRGPFSSRSLGARSPGPAAKTRLLGSPGGAEDREPGSEFAEAAPRTLQARRARGHSVG